MAKDTKTRTGRWGKLGLAKQGKWDEKPEEEKRLRLQQGAKTGMEQVERKRVKGLHLGKGGL